MPDGIEAYFFHYHEPRAKGARCASALIKTSHKFMVQSFDAFHVTKIIFWRHCYRHTIVSFVSFQT